MMTAVGTSPPSLTLPAATSLSSRLRFSAAFPLRLRIAAARPPRTKHLLKCTATASADDDNTSNDKKRGGDIDTTFFDNLDHEKDYPFLPVERPEGYVPPPYFDEGPPETEDEIAAAYEEIYGPAYSGVSVLGNDVNVMDAKLKKQSGFGYRKKKEKVRDGFEERVVQVRRVTKVVKGGKQLHFRAIVVVGDKKGNVGVGVGKAKEVIAAVDKSATNARRNLISVPMTKYSTFPHR